MTISDSKYKNVLLCETKKVVSFGLRRMQTESVQERSITLSKLSSDESETSEKTKILKLQCRHK
jgi:hypothetical protein